MELASTQASGPRTAVARPHRARRWPILAASVAMLAGIATATAIIVMQNKSHAPADTTDPEPSPAPANPTAANPAPSPAPANPAPSPAPADPAPADPAPVKASAPVETGRLQVSSDPTGAMIYVDGELIGPAPTGVALLPGEHVIHAALAGYLANDIHGTINVGAETAVTMLMSEVPAIKPAKVGRPPRPPRGGGGGPTGSTMSQADLDKLEKTALPSEDGPANPAPHPPVKRVDPPKTPATGPGSTTPKPNPY